MYSMWFSCSSAKSTTMFVARLAFVSNHLRILFIFKTSIYLYSTKKFGLYQFTFWYPFINWLNSLRLLKGAANLMNLLFEPSIETIFGSTSAKTIRLFISSQLVDFTVYVPDNDGHVLSTAKFAPLLYTYKLPTYQ